MDTKMSYVYTVYRSGSFTKAARELYISQPSLSAMVKKAEEELGAAIFDRSRNTISLTEAGQIYIDYIEQQLKSEESLKEKIWEVQNLNRGLIRIGGTNYILSSFLPSILKKTLKNYPGIEFVLDEDNSSNLFRRLKDGDLDIVIDSFGNIDPALTSYPIADETFLIAVPQKDSFNQKAVSSQCRLETCEDGPRRLTCGKPLEINLIKELLEKDFILLKPENETYGRVLSVYEQYGLKPNIIVGLDQLATCLNYTEQGIGCCFIPDTPLLRFPQDYHVCLYRLDHPALKRTQYVIHRKDKYMTKATRLFIDIASEIYSYSGNSCPISSGSDYN